MKKSLSGIVLLCVILLALEFPYQVVVADTASAVIVTDQLKGPASHYYQHHVWRAKNRWWVFYSDGAARYGSSPDGVNDWVNGTLYSDVEYMQRIDCLYNGTHFFIVLGYVPLDRCAWFRMGEPHEDGSITWMTEWQNVGKAGAYCTEVSVCADNKGYPWVIRNDDDEHRLNIVTSATRDGTWSARAGFPFELDVDADTEGFMMPVDVNSMYVVWSPTNGLDSAPSRLLGRLWNGTTSSWENEETVTTSIVKQNYKFCGVSTQDKIILAFTDISNNHAKVRTKIIGQDWSDEYDESESPITNTPSLIKLDETRLLILWADSNNNVWTRAYNGSNWMLPRLASNVIAYEGGWTDVEAITDEHVKVGLLFYANLTLYFDVFSAFPNGKITVPDDFPTVQEAINAASDGDTVFVENGTYYENVVVNKTISFVGENMEATIIDANYTGTAVNVTANYVNVTGFTFQHGENPDPFDPVVKRWSGILILKANYTHVSGNIIRQNGMWGIFVSKSNNCTVVNNTICDNGWQGAQLDSSRYCLIDNNTVTGNGYDAFQAMCAVAGQNNTISNNIFVGNSEGIFLSHERYDLIKNNTVRSDSHFNLYLWVSYDCLVVDNVFADCYSGIEESFGGHNMICRNLITNNNIGILYDTWYGVRSYNSFYLNNFGNNTAQTMIPTTKNSTWDDGIKGNYWSDYNGTDLDGDGIGDTPYIVSGDNLDNYPLMEPYSGLHDIGVAVRASKTVAGQGYNTTITLNVTAVNHSEQTEICNLTFSMPETDFEVELNLTGWGSSTFTFALNTTGFTIGNYTLWSYVSPVPSEGDMRDNNRSLTIRVTIPGDISSTSQGVPDGRVDMRDIQYLILCFNTKPSSPSWKPNLDINNDGTVNMRDIQIAILNFNKHE